MPYTIYILTNTTNGKSYVGCTRDYHKRICNHLSLLRRNNHKVLAMQQDYNSGHRFTYAIIHGGISDKKDALALEAVSITENSYNRNKLFLINGYPDGAINKDVLAAIDINPSIKERLAHVHKCSAHRITNLIRSNHIKLSLKPSLMVIRESLQITNSKILNAGYKPIERVRRKNNMRKVWLIPVNQKNHAA